MKRLLVGILLAVMLLSGCSEQKQMQESSLTVQESSTEESVSSYVAFPKGLTTYSKGKLKYTDGTVSVIFSDEFYLPNDSYHPKNGIYLQNENGTATLLIESVKDNAVTDEEMLFYLYETYPYAESSVNGNNEIILRHTTYDQSMHELYTFQCIKTTDSGYRQIVLTCRPSDKDKYQTVFNAMHFS